MKELPTETAGGRIPTFRAEGKAGTIFREGLSITGTVTARASEIPKHDGSAESWDPSLLLPFDLLLMPPTGQTQWEAHEQLGVGQPSGIQRKEERGSGKGEGKWKITSAPSFLTKRWVLTVKTRLIRPGPLRTLNPTRKTEGLGGGNSFIPTEIPVPQSPPAHREGHSDRTSAKEPSTCPTHSPPSGPGRAHSEQGMSPSSFC